MFSKFIGVGLLMVLALGRAHATPITSTVTVAGRDWAQPNLFTDLSWVDITAVCPEWLGGVCNVGGSLSGWTMTGWTWASAQEVGDLLFQETTPHPGGIANFVGEDADWARDFFEVLGFAPTFSEPGWEYAIRGWTRSVLPSTITENALAFGTANIWYSAQANNSFAYTGLSDDDNRARYWWTGGWFHRASTPETPTPVDEPNVLLLLGLGLVPLIVARCWKDRRSAF